MRAMQPSVHKMRAMQPSDLLTTDEARQIIGVESPSTISRWVASGRITPARKLAGRRGAYLFARDEVERVAAEFTAEAAS